MCEQILKVFLLDINETLTFKKYIHSLGQKLNNTICVCVVYYKVVLLQELYKFFKFTI